MTKSPILTQRINPVYLDNASTQGWGWARAATLAVKAAYNQRRLRSYRHRQRGCTNIAAISLTPSDFFTSAMIIFSFPPSPPSPESGTDIGGPGASISTTTSSFGESSAADMIYPTIAVREELRRLDVLLVEQICRGQGDQTGAAIIQGRRWVQYAWFPLWDIQLDEAITTSYYRAGRKTNVHGVLHTGPYSVLCTSGSRPKPKGDEFISPATTAVPHA
jgi:hypothetical protein